MSISYSQRGKKNLWTYRIFDKTGKQLASRGGFKTKTEAKQEAMPLESKLINGLNIDRSITLYQLWKKWYELHIVPQGKTQSTLNKHLQRGKLIEEYFNDTPLRNIKSSRYQELINNYAKTNCRDNVSRLNSEVKKVLDFARQDKIDFHDFTTGVNITGKPPQKKKKKDISIANLTILNYLTIYSKKLIIKKVSFLIYSISNLKQAYDLEKFLDLLGTVSSGKPKKSILIDDTILLIKSGLKQKHPNLLDIFR